MGLLIAINTCPTTRSVYGEGKARLKTDRLSFLSTFRVEMNKITPVNNIMVIDFAIYWQLVSSTNAENPSNLMAVSLFFARKWFDMTKRKELSQFFGGLIITPRPNFKDSHESESFK